MKTNVGFAIVLAAGLCAAGAAAQQGPSISGPSNYNPAGSTQPVQTLDQEDSDRMFREALVAKRSAFKKSESKPQMIEHATATVQELGLSCEVADAEAVSMNKITVANQTVKSETYEVACKNGPGYFVVAQDPQPAVAYSCFAIDGERVAAAAKGQKFDEACLLPANEDLKAMAGAAMAQAGTTCSVAKLQWSGQNTSTKTEYTEVQCADGKGYMLATALAGNAAAPSVLTCDRAAAAGAACQWAKGVAAAPSLASTYNAGKPTFDTFKAYIAAQGIKCTGANVRSIGKENVQKRHVIEFQCPEYPKGLVAFIPLEDSTASFQTLDCDAAKKIGAICKLQ